MIGNRVYVECNACKFQQAMDWGPMSMSGTCPECKEKTQRMHIGTSPPEWWREPTITHDEPSGLPVRR